MPKKLTTEQFIERARIAHNGKYNYSKVVYINNRIKVIIGCPEHGNFMKTPNKHLLGQGCPVCIKGVNARNKAFTLVEFIEKANQIHCGKYDYSQTEYIGMKRQIQYSCPIHGLSEQCAYEHLHSCGCNKCAARRSDTTVFTEKASKVHDGFYSYEKTKYIKNNQNVRITCPVPHHGDFLQTPNSHLMGRGCPDCHLVRLKKRMTGKNNHMYKDGKRNDRWMERRTSEATKWAKAIKRYAEYCDCCGTKLSEGMEKHAHHLYSWIDNFDKRYDLNNGVCLCQECHAGFHSEYGEGSNTPTQYEVYKENMRCHNNMAT